MKPEEYKYEATKTFIQDTEDLDDFQVERYTTPAMTSEEYQKFREQDNPGAIPIRIFNFPWNEKFEGTVIRIGKINIEDDEKSGTASLKYEYGLLNNPNELAIAADDEQSRDNPENELLDVFVGRVVESLLYRMSQDEEFLEKMGENVDK